jgi:prolyl 4-hydroxylase
MSNTTSAQSVTAELRAWIVAQAEAGCRPEDVLAAMRASGWDEEVAVDALESTLRERLDELAAGRRAEAAMPVHDVPEPELPAGATTLTIDGRRMQVLMSLRMPRVLLIGGFLADDECDALVALAAPRLTRSETVDTSTGGSEVNPARTSDGMFFARGETPLLDRVERRIAALLRWPLERGEGMQVLRYRPGAEYRPHHDYFDPAQPGTATVLQRGGQRVGTFLMYLNTPEAGGATVFPDAGLDIAPAKGHALYFSYDRAHASTRTLHGGAPVVAGEKWVATKWLRVGVFV